jgi:UDP-3-O-[3-hydroxymyristoyl] glucosamine N-acyltransferase
VLSSTSLPPPVLVFVVVSFGEMDVLLTNDGAGDVVVEIVLDETVLVGVNLFMDVLVVFSEGVVISETSFVFGEFAFMFETVAVGDDVVMSDKFVFDEVVVMSETVAVCNNAVTSETSVFGEEEGILELIVILDKEVVVLEVDKRVVIEDTVMPEVVVIGEYLVVAKMVVGGKEVDVV